MARRPGAYGTSKFNIDKIYNNIFIIILNIPRPSKSVVAITFSIGEKTGMHKKTGTERRNKTCQNIM